MNAKDRENPKDPKEKPPQAVPDIDGSDIENILSRIKDRERLLNTPKTLLKKEEWGLFTIMNLLLAGLFPVYFVNIMLISLFSEVGHLFTTHLTEVERARLIDFEKEFRLGYEKEKEEKWKEAAEIYTQLAQKYSANPNIAIIADKRVEWLKKNKPA